MDGAIIVGGVKHVLTDQVVKTWHDTGLEFTANDGAQPRIESINLGVLHWIGADREGLEGAEQMHRSMLDPRRRWQLSVEFMIDNSGVIYQFFDPAVLRGRHCSRVNDFSWGVEVSCPGWAKPGRPIPTLSQDRDIYSTRVHGWRFDAFDYYPAQQAAVNKLCSAMCEALAIRKHVFQAPWNRRPTRELRGGGVCGHLHAAHWSKRHPKTDPGTRPLINLAAHFARQNSRP